MGVGLELHGLALIASVVLLLCMSFFLALVAGRPRRCGHCLTPMEVVREQVDGSSIYTVVSFTYRCPACGSVGHGLHSHLSYD